jgi:hypothetical protein
MRQSQSVILYFFIGLIILFGLGLFIFKDNVVDSMLSYNINGPVVNVTKPSSDLKLDILRDSRVKALKNYVSIFDYANLDKSQEAILGNAGKQTDVIISNPDDTAVKASTTQKSLIRVRVGNSNPFFTNKVVK